MIVEVNELTKQIIDFAWELSQNDSSASYPRIASKDELRKGLDRALSMEYERIIVYDLNGLVRGVCIYFWKPSERYAQATQFLIDSEHYESIGDEFIDYIASSLGGYELLVGVPVTNHMAINFFTRRDFTCIECSFDTRLHDLQPVCVNHDQVVEMVGKDTFEEYAVFHDKFAIPSEMYYHSKNLERELECFRILALRDEAGRICGGICAKVFTSASAAEIFAVFVDDDSQDKGFERTLIEELLLRLYNEFGSLKEIVFFVDEDNEVQLNAALTVGFEINDRYRCYRYGVL